MFEFIREWWVVIALIISEVLAFIPSKFSGIAQAIFKILTAIFGKKEAESVKSANKKVIINQKLVL